MSYLAVIIRCVSGLRDKRGISRHKIENNITPKKKKIKKNIR